MSSTRKLLAVLFVTLMVTVCAQGAVAKWAEGPGEGEAQDLHEEVPAPFRELKALVDDLKAVSTDPLDDDNDGLPNSIELIIGTDPQNPDSDFDGVPDQEEVDNGMDPSEPDSNRDGLGDWFEVREASTDIDGDGLHNAWDWDNDGDGVDDGLDMSPGSRSQLSSSIHFNVTTTGEPIYLYFQVRPSNPDNLRLVDQVWDWPSDTEGSMRDLDNSLDDVVVAPLLLMTGDTLPSGDDMALYGAQAQGDVAYMPLFPVWNYGNVVAFKSQMFFSACATRTSLSFDLSLKWKVSGYTDNIVKALKYSNGRYLSAVDAGPVKINATDVRGAQELRWMDQGSNRVGMLAGNGLYLSVGADGMVRASAMQMQEAETFTIVNKTGGGKALRAYNNLYLTVKADGTVVADGATLDSGGDFTIVNMAPKPSITTLAFYADSFVLTGCYFEESRGTDVGVFWPQTQKDGLATGLMMAYNFLRNSTTTVSDMAQWLTDEGVGFNHSEQSFEHRDIAVQALASDLLPAAADALPPGDSYPIVTIMADSYAAVQLYNMTGGGHLTSASITADLGALPIVVAKTMKSNWFEQGADQEVPISDIIVGMRTWEMENEDLVNLIGLSMAWNAGEKTITQVGPVHTTFSYAEIDDVGPTVHDVLANGISGLGMIGTALKAIDSIYACVKFVKLAPFAKPTGIVSAVKMFQSSFKTASSMKTGWLGSVNKACKVIEVIGLVIEIGFALYTLYAIGEAYGWTQVGTGIAVLYSVMMIAYAVVLFAIGQIPIVGWIIALIIALSDAIVGWITGTGWSQRLMEAIIDAITDFKTRSQPDIQMTGADVNIDDKDQNSLDVGDTIEYTSYIVGWVNITSDGSYQDLVDSYVTPYVEVSVPTNSISTTGRSTTKGAETFTTTSKRTEYTATGWATPGTPMVNYPMTITLKANYTCYYDECWWIIFYGWDCNRESTSDVITVDPSTIYFDVMPGSIDAFAAWTALRSCDHDGDGLNDTEEVETDPWKWDTDADGLGDDYELDIGTDPTEFDTDDDGLNDKQEIQIGCDPNKRDSDADGLEDYFEYAGWVVYFDYCGQEFDWWINSSPGFNNTDGDLLDDYLEYVCLLNPRSPDTDGNGWPDDVRDYYKTTFEFRYYMAEAGKPYAIAVDLNGNLYTSTYHETTGALSYIVKWKPDGTSSLFAPLAGQQHIIDMAIDSAGMIYALDYYKGIYKFHPDGTTLGIYGKSGTFQLVSPYGIAIDAAGNMYATDAGSDEAAPKVMVFDKTGAYLRQFGTLGTGDGQFAHPRHISLDSDGCIYVVDQGNNRIQKFFNNGTFITKWGSKGAGTGQFNLPVGIAVDENDDVFVIDYNNNRVQKFNDTGRWIITLGQAGNGDGEFNGPIDICFDAQGEFYVSDQGNYRVQKIGQRVEFIKAEPRYPFTDTDGDGIGDVFERMERTIVIVSTHGIAGIQMLNVTSDPNVPDTDGDGVPDGDEYYNQTDPRSPDTDMDGVTDLEELALGTNLTHYDTDLDSLEDGIEITFMSDPLLQDTDGDGVKDGKEFALGIDPRSRDTDKDGLMDADELLAGSDPRGPDTDADGVFDSYELQIGTRPTLADNDGDGLIDGYEQFYGTDPRSEDSDDDGLGDDFEVDTRLDPLSNDTDSDGVKDARELEIGLNPRSRDSDGDKVLDSVDTDYEIVLPEGVIVTTDADSASLMFADALSAKVKVTQVTPAELLASHKSARYIVVVGDPAGLDGTAGGLIRTLLADSGDLAERMAGSYELRIVMRFGVWAQTQTIILVTNVQPTDAIRVLGMLRSMRATVEGATIEYQYLNERSCFWFEEVDLLKLTDVSLSGKLDEMALFDVKLSKFTEDTTPHKLERVSGLDALYNPTGRYIEVDFSDNVLSPERDILSGLELKMYYTAADLDLTGDGDGDDATDINESTLAAYWYNETSSAWERLDTDMPWVLGLELNTTDVELYGTRYAGCFLMKLAHASLIGQAGLPKGFVPTIARAGPDKTVFVSEEVVLDGSGSEGNGALNYTWTFRYRLGRVTLFGPAPEFVFEEPGEYAITLAILDSLGATDDNTMIVTVVPVTDRSFTLAIGPVLDDIGRPVEGVRARLTVATLNFVRPTGPDGYAPLVLSESFIGMPVIIRFIKSGYEALEYQTTITVAKALEAPPPVFKIVRVPTIARAGADLSTSVGNLTQFDGTESEGNGDVLTYRWTVTFPGGSIVLTGPTPTHTFLGEGVYDVTLNVTDVLGVSAEDTLKVTVGPRWSLTFTLSVGPIVDSTGRVLEGISVRITFGRDVYSNTTNALGMALVEVPSAAIGPEVWVSLVGDKYGTVQYKTTIGADQTLAQPPAAMTAKKAPATHAGAISTGLAIGLVLVLVLVLIIIALLVIRRRRGPPAEDAAAEAGLEPVTVDQKAHDGFEEIGQGPSKDDGAPKGADEGAEAPESEEEHVVSRPVTHQKGRGKAPPKAVAPAPKGGVPLKEQEAESEIETD